MTRRVSLLALGAALAAPATAAAQDADTTTAAPAAEAPVLRVAVQKTGPQRTVLAGDSFRVRGTLKPFVAGQTVTLRGYRNGTKKVFSKKVKVRPSRTGASGTFLASAKLPSAGRVVLRATKSATAAQPAAVAKGSVVRVAPRRVKKDASGAQVRILQELLDEAGYVVGERGRFDARTARAIVAFRKLSGLERTSEASTTVLRRLANGGGRFPVKFPDHGRHIEADISKQVLALIGEGGKVERIYPTSTGAPATPTILGSYKVYRKDFGTNALGMVHSAYFIRGYAIHGYKDVPTYNASHGCLRVPVPDAKSIFDWVRMNTRVDTYR